MDRHRTGHQLVFLLAAVTLAAPAAHAGVPFCRELIDASTEEVDCELDEAAGEIDALAKAKHLTRVSLAIASLATIAPLASARDLAELSLINTRVGDLSPLAAAKRLRNLTVVGGPLADLAPAAAWPALEILRLEDVPVADLTPLAKLKKLRLLILTRTGVADLTPLAGLRALTFLQIEGGPVSDLSPLAKLPALATFDAVGVCPNGLGAEGFPALRSLTVAPSCAFDLRWLARRAKLQRVSVAGAVVGTLAELGLDPAHPVGWVDLDISRTRVASLAGVAALPKLESLTAEDAPLADLDGLGGAKALVACMLNRTRISDVSALARLPKLRNLYLIGTPVADLSPLAASHSLEQLYLTGTPVADLSPLAALHSLERLYIAGTPAAKNNAGIAALRKANPKLEIVTE